MMTDDTLARGTHRPSLWAHFDGLYWGFQYMYNL